MRVGSVVCVGIVYWFIELGEIRLGGGMVICFVRLGIGVLYESIEKVLGGDTG